VSPRAHLAAGVMVAFSAVISGVFVMIANSWMNTPVGFRLVKVRDDFRLRSSGT
jgi:cytochrome bd ubiquinol oxidase subunit I